MKDAQDDVVLPPEHGLSLCAGGGGLDMGVELACPRFATACYVEWDAYPRRCLIAAQEAGYFRPAPIWDNVKTFDARPWRGIDTLLAGYPCQPFSAAGLRKGEEDPRHLWPDIERVITELGDALEWVFLENVPGHLSLGFETVARALYRLGFRVAAMLVSAGETGASQKRQRLFVLAHRPGAQRRWKTGCRHWRARREEFGSGAGRGNVGRTDIERVCLQPRTTVSTERGSGCQRTPPAGDTAFSTGDDMAIGTSRGCRERRDATRSGRGRHLDRGDDDLAGTRRTGLEGGKCRVPPAEGDGQDASGPIAEFCRPYLHAPGPKENELWRAALDVAPDLAPAVSAGDIVSVANIAAQMVAQGSLAEATAQSLVCRMADGLAARTRALRLLGNGVHPLAAAHAFRSLSATHGLAGVDLETNRGS